MKNKKLFAILTLVCFMFTLMPVAAFAADFDEQSSYVFVNDSEVKKGKDIEMELDLNAVTDTIYVWFEEVGYEDVAVKAVAPSEDEDANCVAAETAGFIAVDASASKNVEFIVTIDRAGEFEVHAAAVIPETLSDFADELRTQNGYDTVVVNAAASVTEDYVIEFEVENEDEEIESVIVADGDSINLAAIVDEVPATNGIEVVTVEFTVYEDYEDEVLGDTVYAKDIEIDTTSGVEVSDLEVKRSGVVAFDVAVTKAGNHKIYVIIDDFKATIKVNATEVEAEEIELSYISRTPVNIESANQSVAAAGLGNWMVFQVYNSNGNEVAGYTEGLSADKAGDPNTKYVTLTEQPADSDLKSDNFYLAYVPQAVVDRQAAAEAGWVIKGIPGTEFVEEGTYTFKVALDDGTYATASLTLKEAGDPVAMSITYDTASVQLGAEIAPKAVVWLDKNYVSTKVDFDRDTNVKFAVSGAAVKSVDGQKIVVKDDEKYVGSTITVTVVDQDNNLSAKTTLTVAAEAKELVFDADAAPVDSVKTIGIKLVDEDGKTVGLNATTAEAYAIVLDKPADAEAEVDVIGSVNKTTGAFQVTFSADTVGVYKVQAVMTAEVDNVVRYYTGVGEIKVGATGIEDTVVMSIGANKVVVNDKVVAIDAAPMIKDSRTFVPFRALAEAFGATVEFDAATQAVVAELDGTKVVMTIGDKAYTVNGVAKTADVAPFISDSRTMVPVRFVAEAFGITVTPIAAEDGSIADVLFTK